mmetsp:Transcript_17771/g.54126  ORF Transcript_17771/g.54126 Transcript_17771/m.54126 type:complete len:347 (-) Transcript_17771:869-1909(-)
MSRRTHPGVSRTGRTRAEAPGQDSAHARRVGLRQRPPRYAGPAHAPPAERPRAQGDGLPGHFRRLDDARRERPGVLRRLREAASRRARSRGERRPRESLLRLLDDRPSLRSNASLRSARAREHAGGGSRSARDVRLGGRGRRGERLRVGDGLGATSGLRRRLCRASARRRVHVGASAHARSAAAKNTAGRARPPPGADVVRIRAAYRGCETPRSRRRRGGHGVVSDRRGRSKSRGAVPAAVARRLRDVERTGPSLDSESFEPGAYRLRRRLLPLETLAPHRPAAQPRRRVSVSRGRLPPGPGASRPGAARRARAAFYKIRTTGRGSCRRSRTRLPGTATGSSPVAA